MSFGQSPHGWLASALRLLSPVSSSPPAPCLPRSYVSSTDSCMLSRPANWCAAHCVPKMAVVLTANASADNTCNCYEPPAAPKLLTIARLSNIAFMGHACASLLIYAPLGLAIVMVVFENDADPFLIVMCVIYGLIAVSRVATTSTGRIVWPGPNMRNPS